MYNNLMGSFWVPKQAFDETGSSMLNAKIMKHGLDVYCDDDRPTDAEQRLLGAFERGEGFFILELAFESECQMNDPAKYLKQVSEAYLRSIAIDPAPRCEDAPGDARFSIGDLAELLERKSSFEGLRYIDENCLKALCSQLSRSFSTVIAEANISPSEYLSSRRGAGSTTRAICFHLVESKDRTKPPFAFMASLVTAEWGHESHAPLRAAIEEMSKYPMMLAPILECIRLAAEKSELIAELANTKKLLSPTYFTDEDAYRFLCEVDVYEALGIICRIPKWSRNNANQLTVDPTELDGIKDRYLDAMSINCLVPSMTYHGVCLSEEEARRLLAKKEGLYLVKGRWVAVNHRQLKSLLDAYEHFSQEGLSLADAYSEMARGRLIEEGDEVRPVELAFKDWEQTLSRFSSQFAARYPIPARFCGTLREYQKEGYRWLCGLLDLGFGVCLADDMGLGKTAQAIAWLLHHIESGGGNVLIVVPTTLIANWEDEMGKFAPSLDYFVLPWGMRLPSGKTRAAVTICSYQTARESEYLGTVFWDAVILDEAQAIKNHNSRQSRKIRSLKAGKKIALTGTPIENHIMELWTLFDFLDPGLLGSLESFKKYAKWAKGAPDGFSLVKSATGPLILRRLKSDKSIIDDLPEKTEVLVPLELTIKQAVLYRDVLEKMNERLGRLDDARQRLPIIATTLMRLKQICNHPSQFTGDKEYEIDDSSKFQMLFELGTQFSSNGEKVIVFTQFKEIIPALDKLLQDAFHESGAAICGDTPMRKRADIVRDFQSEKLPYLILSIKTAGTGLNLTAASNVVHFDRWWNPAVENQATDRAYRIGQKNNVFVYKFCTGDTIEELIDAMINSKRELAEDIISASDGNVTSKFTATELLEMITKSGRLIDDKIRDLTA